MWMTTDHVRKVAGPVIQPFLTPRPERRSRVTDPTFRPLDFNTNPQVNVQVLLRCRPLSDEEQRLNVAKVITCNEQKREVAVLQNVANKQVDKFFTFDKVFGPKAQQRSIYEQSISPVVNEVLEGFNCTIFAYGQTGTGKTYTMEGEMRNKGGELPTEAGVIPRAVRQIFDTLEAQNADYSMKVTFLELYNEEIVDLLAPEDYARSLEERQKKPVSLMEDGNGCVLVRGLEEEAVYSATDIYNLLERGAAKRHIADTLLNKRSSRSHSVFTITVHIKQANLGNEEVIKYGKLNLVDLAGSENISRSGARESENLPMQGRAKEAGEINKSLLTLGRVINALVEHSGHVPYRDSKLTRLLRDSLGGKTKTCIIATISPSAHCLEETLSTLDYARRAKNIKNRPEANQKMSKAMLLKDLYLEMEKMKQDLRAARERNGVYIPHERFAQDEAEKKAKNEKIEELEIDLNISKKKLDKYHELYLDEQQKRLTFENDLKDCMINLESSNKALQDVQVKYSESTSLLKQKEFIISRLLDTERCLIDHAKQLRGELQNASEDISALFSKIDYKSKLEAQNQGLLLTFGSQLDHGLNDLHKTVLCSVSQQQQQLRSMEEHVFSFLASKSDKIEVLESRIKNITETYTSGLAAVKMLGEMLQMKASSDLEHAKSRISSHVVAVEKFFENAISEAKNTIYETQNSINEQKQMLAFSMQQQKEGLFRSLVSANVISKATIDFFNDLRERAITVMAVIEEGHNNKLHKMAEFEKAFKEDAAREEKLAMEKIAAILGNLTAKKSDMVSEASRNITDLCSQQRKTLQQEMSIMQQVSDVAKGEVNEYIEKVKNQFIEDTIASNENRALMENCLQECANDMETSMQHWDNRQSAINGLNKCSIAETELMLREKNCENNIKHEEIASRCLFTEAQLKTKTSELMLEIHDSLMLDREIKKEFDSLSNICLDQLTCLCDRHGVSMKNLQNRAEQCLTKDYLVDQNNNVITPRRREVKVPSLASIEEMRTPSAVAAHVDSGTPQKSIQNGNNGNKIDQGQKHPSVDASPNRIPFADLN